MSGRRWCIACGDTLAPDLPAYITRCKPCYAAGKRRELAELLDENARLRAEVERLRGHHRIEPAILRWLLQLAHPDKHNGSKTAHAAASWLLSLRQREAVDA